jgi:diguanylate cyclase (GGDEF)-like protein
VIVEFAAIIKRLISSHGIMARYGGDEFSILLPETDIKKAKEIGEEIRGAVENGNYSKHFHGKKIPVTTSIGISSYPETASTVTEFMQKADAALYRAKDAGKNRVECV